MHSDVYWIGGSNESINAQGSTENNVKQTLGLIPAT